MGEEMLKVICPGFGQDRVNFHQNPGRGTAWQADPTWPNTAGYSIPCAIMLGSGGGELEGGNSLTAREPGRRSGPGGWLSGLCGLCCVFSSSVSLLLLFPLFAVLLNCPYPDPPVSARFFPFSSAPRRREGKLRDAFVASCSQTITLSQVVSLSCLGLFSSHFFKGPEKGERKILRGFLFCYN